MPKALDITNKRFGHLVAIEKAPSKGKKTYWTCKCDCGIIKDIQTGHLTSGVTTTCGDKSCSFHFNPITSNIHEERKCLICNTLFISNSPSRKYCYECSPEGVGSKIALRYKTRAIKHNLVQYKGGKCEKCGYDKCEGALQFHHLNPQEKEFSLSHINLNGETVSLETLYLEVDKCLLLCANCHAEEHYLDDLNC